MEEGRDWISFAFFHAGRPAGGLLPARLHCNEPASVRQLPSFFLSIPPFLPSFLPSFPSVPSASAVTACKDRDSRSQPKEKLVIPQYKRTCTVHL